ncbi:aspartate kinase [Flammeovirga kamogawensis]|uniref:Aspartate kinase n=1 Tax=Flammeovirga kamogawensis TaxID=373891 RepID=A0ABX8GTA8_9BACT|nr:aspartate kinase [Flammeovirga kamogawensis]MBB6463410.1 hypothetical protein [Flammeovirga kamogawensis]QWG06621.1 hypothetical protein KM029_15075 [Flammeovirga kamogawensis]TRX68444.1 aspartate kinase [Flammeovirga kamogawensis]
MLTLAEVIAELINESPFLQEGIAEGIINYSALARKLHPEIEQRFNKEVQQGAIVMALKRMAHKVDASQLEDQAKDYIRHMGDILVRSDLVDFAYKNSPTLIRAQKDLLELVQNSSSDLFHASSKGMHETNIITSRTFADKVKELFWEEEKLSEIQDLAAVTMRMPISYTKDAPGVFYHILKTLAWNKINVVEFISTKHEFSIIIEKEEINHTFKLLHDMKNS